MTQFFHEHPVLEKDGSFTIEHVIPAAGQYMLFSDFMPVGGGPQMIATPLVDRRLRGRHRLVVAEPQAGHVVREDRERREGRLADRAGEDDRRRRSRRADPFRG